MFLKYLDLGYFTLPIKHKSKATALPAGYSLHDWATQDGISYETLEKWEKLYPIEKGYGIALLCGKASNIIAVDIDTDDLKAIELIPESPCEKIGARATRFFRYSSDYERKINIGKNESGLKDHIEILTSGQYCILPPSVHPETGKNYFWSSEENLLWVTADELPELPIEVISALQNYYAKKYKDAGVSGHPLSGTYISDGSRAPHGSHDRLKQLAATLIRFERPIDEAVRELIDYDNSHHTPIGYFSDKTRGADSKLDPETNAARFYLNQLVFINRQRIMQGEMPHSVLKKELIIDLGDAGTLEIDLVSLKPYPQARGIMATVQDYVQTLAPFKQDAISLGGALALMSVLCANRFRTQIGHYDVRPNLYVLNLAKSGAGKETVQSLLIDLLAPYNLLGSGGYKSGTSIVQDLPERQERLNVIDEAAAWLKSIGQGEGFQQEMNDILSGLFTRASGFYPGIALATSRESRFGACWNPSVSILASTTLHGFKGAVNRDMGAKGLLPRFLTFWQHSLGEYKAPKRSQVLKAEELKKQICAFVERMTRLEKRLHPEFKLEIDVDLNSPDTKVQNFGKRYDPILVPICDHALERYFEYAKAKAPKDTLQDSFDEPFLNRHAELAGKIALLDTISRGEAEISLESLEWAIGVVDTQWHNMQNIFKETSAENLTEKTQIRVLELIKSCGGIIARRELSRKTQWLKKAERAAVLESLEESGLVERVTVEAASADGKKTKPEVSYRVTSKA